MIIAGPARSGTSILFELLALHADLRAPISAEALHPVPLPETGLADPTDPGSPNWLDTEGRPFGIAFGRFMLTEGEIESPQAELVPLADLPAHL